MRPRRFQIVLFAAAALAGAAGCGGSGNKASDPQHVTVCSEQAVTGSQIGRMRCHRKIDQEERARRDRRFMEQMQHEKIRTQVPMGPPS